MSTNENPNPDQLTEILGKPICVLTSNSTETDRHYEEAGSVNEEMQLHQDKIQLPHYLIEQAE